MTRAITHASVERALDRVLGELRDVGLLTRRLFDVPVVTTAFDVGAFLFEYEGLYIEDPMLAGRLIGLQPRTIYVPVGPLLRLQARLRGGTRSSLADILRHELGHAFAVEHPQLVRRSSEFRSVFGYRYDDDDPLDEHDCVSSYAATNAAEDFAETFMVYLRCCGTIGRFRGQRAVHRKLRFVRGLADEVVRRGLS